MSPYISVLHRSQWSWDGSWSPSNIFSAKAHEEAGWFAATRARPRGGQEVNEIKTPFLEWFSPWISLCSFIAFHLEPTSKHLRSDVQAQVRIRRPASAVRCPIFVFTKTWPHMTSTPHLEEHFYSHWYYPHILGRAFHQKLNNSRLFPKKHGSRA